MISFDSDTNEIIVDFNKTSLKRKYSTYSKEEYERKRIQSLQEEIIYYFNKAKYKAITDLYTIRTRMDLIQYICPFCKEIKTKCFKKILENKLCKLCITIQNNIPRQDREIWTDPDTNEEWRETIYGNYLSSFGHIKNRKKVDIKSTYGKIYINKKHHHIVRLIYITFELPNYNLLLGEEQHNYVVSYKDGNNQNMNITNLYLRSRAELVYGNIKRKNN
jgi:hypothetical protein